jgi:hypothetical protein
VADLVLVRPMPLDSKTRVLFFVGIGCVLLGSVGDSTFHLPAPLIFIALGVGLICAFLAFRRMRAGSRDDISPAASHNWLQRTWANKSSRFWFIVVLLALVMLIAPLLSTRPSESPQANAVISIVTFVFSVTLVFIVLRWKRP